MSSTRTIWPFVDEILAERGPWRLYGVNMRRTFVLDFGIEIEATILLSDIGTGRHVSISLLGGDPPTLRDLSRAGYTIGHIGRHSFANRSFASDRELVAEIRRWEAIAEDGSLRHLPTRKKRRASKRPTIFPTSAIAAVRDLDGWGFAFAGAQVRSPGRILGAPSLSLLTYASVAVDRSLPTALSVGMHLHSRRENATTAADVKKHVRRMRALLRDPKYRQLGKDQPYLCFFEKEVRSLAGLRRGRKRLAGLISPEADGRLRAARSARQWGATGELSSRDSSKSRTARGAAARDSATPHS